MMRFPLRRGVSALALCGLLLTAACGSDDDSASDGTELPGDDGGGATDDTGTTDDSSTDDGDDGSTDGGGSAQVPDDICALVSADEVAALTGEAGVEARAVPGGGCQYPDETARGRYPLITVTEDVSGAGGIDGARSGAEAIYGASGSDLTVSGASGYVVSGEAMGSGGTQAAVAHQGLIISVTLSGDDADAADIAEQLIALVIAAL